MHISKIPLELRPREKLLRVGAGYLTDVELLATILGTGTKGRDVLRVAREVLHAINSTTGQLDSDTLLKIKGIGTAKGIQILAAQEFFRRRIQPHGTVIESPADLLPHLRSLTSRNQEHFISASLNGAQELIQIRVITIGILDKVQIHPREVFADAITDRAAAVIIAHNHPSQCLEPSTADEEITKRLIEGGDLLGIPVLDHIIFNQTSFFSMRERGRGGFGGK